MSALSTTPLNSVETPSGQHRDWSSPYLGHNAAHRLIGGAPLISMFVPAANMLL